VFDVCTFWGYNKLVIYEYAVFEWDEQKRNLVSLRGIDIVLDAPIVLNDERAVTALSPQKGEIRYKTIGLLNGKLYAVIHTPRNGNCRIITMRRAHKNEKEDYHDNSIG
jgi:uncharacterized DUF497 family protein